ncbi:NAD(P)H-binding protein [Cryptosporangium sp. NPDC048952]|uniref:NAD(P)H-binding protein n=1 Tax=Cryptosporangium sp. NPDC048952 TaxID=3363961 RepID=UPI003710677F
MTRGRGIFLVAGATGNVGGGVTRHLLDAGCPVRALVRPGSKGPVPAGAAVVEADLNDRASLRSAYADVEAAFLLAGYPDMPGILADLNAAGVERVVLLSSGCVVGGDLDNAVVRFNVVSEAAVRDSGLPWTVLRPSGFMSNTLQWVDQLRTGDVVREPFADVPIAVIDPDDIAAVASLVLRTPGHDAQSYRLTGPDVLLPAERAAILGAVLQRPIQLQPEPDDQARVRMEESMPPEMVDAFFQFFRRGGYDDAHVNDVAPTLLGRPLRTFRAWADANHGAFGGLAFCG